MENIKMANKELYNAVYGNKDPKCKQNELATFVAMKGRYYDEQKVRVLIVGRATNGWGQLDVSSAEKFAENAIKDMDNNHFDWIVYESKGLRNDCKDNSGKYYWLNKSPFWRVSKKIWQELSNNDIFIDSAEDRWVDHIAWSNLYKVAPEKSGNPSNALCRKQLEACKKILKAEIDSLKPTHILFVTGFNWWFDDFKDIFDGDFGEVKQNEYRSNKKNDVYAEVAAIKNGIKIVIACRPELRNEDAYIIDIVKAYNNLAKGMPD